MFVDSPDEMFEVDRFHPPGADYRRTARAVLPSVAIGLREGARQDTTPRCGPRDRAGEATASSL
jgi:hypothetical protein